MKLSAVELRRLRVPLVEPFRTSSGTRTWRDVLVLRAITPDAEGWSEYVGLETPSYSPEYVDGAVEVVRRFLLPSLFALDSVRAADVGPALAWVRGHPMAKAAVEAAVLDAELRLAGRSLAEELGAVRTEVDCGVVVGMAASIPELLEDVGRGLDQGYRRVKLKIGPGWDVEPVRSVRERFGDVPLQVDANAAYTVGDSRHLTGLDEFGLVLLEQPLAEDDLAGHAALARVLDTPICLDESIVSARSAETAIAFGACSIVNVKPGRVGGYLEARRVHDVCVAQGVPVWCGGMFETGIGRAANLALAALPGFTLPGDISASDRYFTRDVTTPFVLEDGRLRVPTGPGIGVDPLPDALDELTVDVETIRPT